MLQSALQSFVLICSVEMSQSFLQPILQEVCIAVLCSDQQGSLGQPYIFAVAADHTAGQTLVQSVQVEFSLLLCIAVWTLPAPLLWWQHT